MIAEGERDARRQAALAGDRDKLERAVRGDDRQVLVLRDLAEADDGDPVPACRCPPAMGLRPSGENEARTLGPVADKRHTRQGRFLPPASNRPA